MPVHAAEDTVPLLPSRYCWSTLVLIPTHSPRSFSTELLPRQAVLSLCLCWGLSLPRTKAVHLLLLNVIKLLLAHPSSLCWLLLDCSPILDCTEWSACSNWWKPHEQAPYSLLQVTDGDIEHNHLEQIDACSTLFAASLPAKELCCPNQVMQLFHPSDHKVDHKHPHTKNFVQDSIKCLAKNQLSLYDFSLRPKNVPP